MEQQYSRKWSRGVCYAGKWKFSAHGQKGKSDLVDEY